MTTICSTIDHLIQMINEVKICQEQMKLIANSLTRLRNILNEVDVSANDRNSHEDIEQTLRVITNIVASYNENETDLNGVTYRDLQSLLLRLQWRLAQHETNMTAEQEVKIQRLSDAYREMYMLIEMTVDQTTKQRLQEIEQHTKENTIEQLRLLREKHTETIETHLRSCIELHKSIPLIDFTPDAVSKVTHSFYQVTTKDRFQFALPLTSPFTRFEADRLTAFERNELRRLLTVPAEERTSKCAWQHVVSTPCMLSVAERHLSFQKEEVNAENIIRIKRWIVILGDPGSGKTSFARWLVHHLAEALLLNEQHSTEYGPLRLPILIRVREFAEKLKRRPSLTLFDYIGNGTLQDYIQRGQALIILDGLDDIPASFQRSRLVDIVEDFVHTYVQIPTGPSALDNPHLSRLLDDPSKSGGNQLIVTSRIVGYHAVPLAGQFSHYTMQPMNAEQTKKFVNHWFFHVHQQILETLNLSVANQGETHAEVLNKELEKPENAALLKLTTNPALMSIICQMSFNQLDDTPLPIPRIRQYDQIIESMFTRWNSRSSIISKPKLIRMLSDIAFHIQQYAPSNSIDQEEMNEVCFQLVKTFKNKRLLTPEDIQDIDNQTSEFARIIEEDLGILTIRNGSSYGFLHSTFQDYFTALKLIEMDKSRKNEIELIVQSMRHHFDDPRFRVPIALALAHISATWSQQDFDDFSRNFIEEQDHSDSLLPLGAYLFITCSGDMVKYPSNDIFFAALDRLMIAAGRHCWSMVCPFLFDQITNALRKLPHDILSLWIENFLRHCSPHDTQTLGAFCYLIEGKPHEFANIEWLDQSSCSTLQSLSIIDNEKNQFAIDRLLVKVAFSNHQLLPINRATFKGFLLDGDISPHSVRITLLPLIIILYGGLKRDGQTVLFDPSYIHRESTVTTPILTRFLSVTDHARQDQAFKKLKQEFIKSFLARIDNHDESYETVDLCIVILCLYGIEYIQENITIIPNSLLRLTMERLKYLSMILRQFYFTGDESDRIIENETTRFISVAIEKFQYGESARVQFLDLLHSLKNGVARLRSSKTSILLEGETEPYKRMTLYLPNSLRKEEKFLHGLLPIDTRFSHERNSCSLLHHFTRLFWILEHGSEDEQSTECRMFDVIKIVPDYLVFRNDEDLLCSLIFIPPHLQNLYLRLLQQKLIIINARDINGNEKHCLYFGHILTECLMMLTNTFCKRLIILAALINLLPCLRMQKLATFGSSLLWSWATKELNLLAIVVVKEERPINDETGQYMDTDENLFSAGSMTDEQRQTLVRLYIDQEHERIQKALTENDGRNMKLYSASICLARICRWSEDERRLSLLNDSVKGAMSITNKLVRLDALCVIALYSHSDHGQIQVVPGRSMQEEIEHLFNEIYPTLPLLLHTTIFIRCLPLLRDHQMIDRCLQNLFDKFGDNDQRDQKAVTEALSPYLQSNSAFFPLTKYTIHSLSGSSKTAHNRSSMMKKHFSIITDQNLPLSVLVSNLYLTELAKDVHECLKSHFNQFNIEEIDEFILTEVQAMKITNILSSTSSTDQSQESEKMRRLLSNALHRVNTVEFKARYFLESWLKWKDSNELSVFAYHAALLLASSDLWSVEAATIICDLLCHENDRFRRRAEIFFRSSSDHDVPTSSKMGIDVLLILMKKRTHYQVTSSSAKLSLTRLFSSITLDIQSQLESFLWLERYRIHVLANRNCNLQQSRLWTKSYVASYFSDDVAIDSCACINLFKLSGDLVIYMCDMIACKFFSFLDIDGDSISDAVLESHSRFVISVLLTLDNLLNDNDELRQMALEALMSLFDICGNDDIRQAVACSLGYVCNEKTYKRLFEKIQTVSNNGYAEASDYPTYVLTALISSYSYCVIIHKIAFDQDDMDLFSNLLRHSSEDVVKAVRTGYGRGLRDTPLLLGLLDCDYTHCYHALTGSTAYLYLYDVQENSEIVVADLIEQNPVYLSIFITDLYHSIRHFSDSVLPIESVDYDLAYGYPQYVRIASFIVQRIPVVFCAYIKNWPDGEKLKRALFYTSKQHSFPQRAACLTILSMFGELTIELCQMLIAALHDDPHIQNTSYKCLTRITTIADKQAVTNLLLEYLKSKSMNVRYVAAKILLHLSKSSLIPFKQVQTVLNTTMLDPYSNEALWLIEPQENLYQKCVYYYAGPLKDAICALLVQYLTGETNGNVRRNEFNDIDSDFIESEKAARLSSCVYEAKIEASEEVGRPQTPNIPDGDDRDTLSPPFSLGGNESD